MYTMNLSDLNQPAGTNSVVDGENSPPILKLQVDSKPTVGGFSNGESFNMGLAPGGSMKDALAAFNSQSSTTPQTLLTSQLSLNPQLGSEIILKRPSNPAELPKANGINIISSNSTDLDIDSIMKNLKSMGIETKAIMYMRYPEGLRGLFLHAVTIHGQYVFIELPLGIVIRFGDLELEPQRVGIVTTSLQDTFKEELKDIHTGYVFLTIGGLQYIKSKKHSGTGGYSNSNGSNNSSQEQIIYDYGDNNLAESLFQLKKYQFLIIPAVHYSHLIEPARLNTIEAYLDLQLENGNSVAKELVLKTGLATLLTMKGPFTVFLPNEKLLNALLKLPLEKARSVLLAHIVQGRIESETFSSSSQSSKLTTLAHNEIHITNGVVSSGKHKSKIDVTKAVKKYNGIVYTIDTVFVPLNENFKLPEKSDFDDVVTIFDISRSTMEIRKAEYAINRHNHEQFLTVLGFIGDLSTKLFNVINERSDGRELLDDSNALMEMFYAQEVPCKVEFAKVEAVKEKNDVKWSEKSVKKEKGGCAEMDVLAKKVRQENLDFENLLRVSNALGALKVPIERIYQKIQRIDQQLNVKKIINVGQGVIPQADDEDNSSDEE